MRSAYSTHADASARSRTVLVQDDAVVAAFPDGQDDHARKTARNVVGATGKPVAIYAIRDGLPEPPLVGTAVRPALLGWKPVQKILPD
jgi:hypothetical protein